MPAFELIGLAILWSIGLLAVIQTINSRGAIRTAISGIITVILLLMACFFSYLKFEGYGSFVSPMLSPTSIIAANISANEAEFNKRTSDSTQNSMSSISNDVGMSKNALNSPERYISSAEKIADEALSLVKEIEKFKALPNDIDEPSRETAESKALALRNATAKVNSKAAALFHPKSVSELHSKLVSATEGLRLAGYALHAYTTLENAADKQAQFEQSKRQAAAAAESISAYKSELGKLLKN